MPLFPPISSRSFPKTERLCNRSLINALYSEGNHFTVYPIRVQWKNAPADLPAPAQVLINVQRKHFRSAVKRNRIKRIIREVYRNNKAILHDTLARQGTKAMFSLVYFGKSILTYHELEPIIIVILRRLSREYEKGTG